MKKILGVVRASTEHQEIISQKAELESFILSLGFTSDEIEWIEVAGASARKADKEYLNMLQSIKDKITINDTIRTVAFWHLNRLGRIDTHLVLMKNWFIDNKIQVYIKNPSLQLLNDDYTVNAGGEIAWNVYAAMVKLETEEMFEKLKRGKKRNAEAGIFNGGNIQFGYKLNTATRKLEPNPEEVELLKIIFEEYTQNKLSTHQLAKELNNRGLTQRDRKITAVWIQRILASEIFKELVGETLFNKAQSIRANRNVNRKTKHIHIAGGLVTCPTCGGRMFAEMQGYKCYNHYNQHRNETSIYCDNTAKVSTEIIDNLAFEVAIINYADFVAESNKEVIEDYKKEIAINRQKIEANKKKLEKYDTKRERVKSLYIEGDITKKEFQAVKAKIIGEYNEILDTNFYYAKRNDELTKKIEALNTSVSFDRLVDTLDSADEFTAKEAFDIVHKFISNITYKKTAYGRYTITITTINEKEHTFNYYSYKKSGSKVMMLNNQGKESEVGLLVRFENGEKLEKPKYI